MRGHLVGDEVLPPLPGQPRQERGLPTGTGAQIQPRPVRRLHPGQGQAHQLRTLVLHAGPAFPDRSQVARSPVENRPEGRVHGGDGGGEFPDLRESGTHHEGWSRCQVVDLQSLGDLVFRQHPFEGLHDPAGMMGDHRQPVRLVEARTQQLHPFLEVVRGNPAPDGVDQAGDPLPDGVAGQFHGGVDGRPRGHSHAQCLMSEQPQ